MRWPSVSILSIAALSGCQSDPERSPASDAAPADATAFSPDAGDPDTAGAAADAAGGPVDAAGGPVDAAGGPVDAAGGPVDTGMPAGDPWWADATQPCARLPQAFSTAAAPADLLHRAATYQLVVRARGGGPVAPDGWSHPELPMFIRVKPLGVWWRDGVAATTISLDELMEIRVRAGAVPAVGSESYHFLTAHIDPTTGRPIYLEGRTDLRLPAAGPSVLPDTLPAARSYLAARPAYARSIAESAAIAEVTVLGTQTLRSPHCSTPERQVTARVERALCGGVSGQIEILVPAHGIGGCAGAPDQGPAPALAPGQRAVVELGRHWAGDRDAPTGYYLWRSDAARPPAAFDELAALRQSER